jgi:hypothetical protein
MRAIARHGLQQHSSHHTVTAGLAASVLDAARFDHLTGFLATSVLDGDVTFEDDEDASCLFEQWHAELLGCVALEALAVRAAAAFDSCGVPFRLTKGPALAHLDYPEPSQRTFGDVDIVIHPDHWQRAIEALRDEGFTREVQAFNAAYDHRFGKGATMTSSAGLEVDLHRRFAIGRFGVGARMDELFTNVDVVVLGGRSIPVLAADDRLLHACYHAALGGFRRFRAFRDLAQLVIVSGVDLGPALETARRWGGGAVVASAVLETWRRLELDWGHPAYRLASTVPISRGDRRALDVFARELPFRNQALTALGRLRPWQVPGYLWTLGQPTLARRNPRGQRSGTPE